MLMSLLVGLQIKYWQHLMLNPMDLYSSMYGTDKDRYRKDKK